jgi:DNA-binding MltR family transcriptional regulator
MTKKTQMARLERANQMADALKAETDRGRACVGDAMLDEVFLDLFRKGFIKEENEVAGMLGQGQPLGNYGARLKLAHLLGWIGPEAYADCQLIHRIRNRMAHELDVDTFDHPRVRDLLDNLESPRHVTIHIKGKPHRLNLKRRQDKFIMAVQLSLLRCWWFIDHRQPVKLGVDPLILRMPKPAEQTSPG